MSAVDGQIFAPARKGGTVPRREKRQGVLMAGRAFRRDGRWSVSKIPRGETLADKQFSMAIDRRASSPTLAARPFFLRLDPRQKLRNVRQPLACRRSDGGRGKNTQLWLEGTGDAASAFESPGGVIWNPP